MKTKLKTALILLGILLATNSFATEKSRYRYEFTKKINERFTVAPNSKLDIDTRRGNVVVVEGVDNEIVVDVVIEYRAERERDLEELKRGIDVEIYKSANTVYAKTDIDLNNLNRISYKINFFVTVPKDYIPNIVNKYGNVRLEGVATSARLEVKYGNIYAKLLKATAQIEMKYSDLTVEKAETIKMGMGYGKSNIGWVDKIDIGEYKYGNLSIENAGVVEIEEFKYGRLTIDMLNNSFECEELRYSKLNIEKCSDKITKIDVDSGYSPIRITLPETLQFTSNLSTRYGNISNEHSDRMTIRDLESGGSSVNERATTKGDNSSMTEINISSSYANIYLYK